MKLYCIGIPVQLFDNPQLHALSVQIIPCNLCAWLALNK